MRKLGVALFAVCVLAGAAFGAYPEKNIQGYIMWGAGGAMDNVSRAIVPIAQRKARYEPSLVKRIVLHGIALAAFVGFCFYAVYLWQRFVPAAPAESPSPVAFPAATAVPEPPPGL